MAAFLKSSTVWRIAVAAVFLLSQAVLTAADLGDDDTLVAVAAAMVVPVLVGFLIARPWALALALAPIGLYAIDSDTTDLNAGAAIGGLIAIYLVCLGIGVLLGRSAGLGRRAPTHT